MIEELSEHRDRTTTQPSGAQQQALLEFAVSQSSAVFYIAHRGGRSPVRFISSNVESITGHKPEAFLRNAGYGAQFIHKDDYPGYIEKIRRLEDAGTLTHEYRFATPDGAYRWIRDELRIIQRSEGPMEFVGCMVDITKEKESQLRIREAEEKHRSSAQLLRDAVESLPTGFVIYDNQDRVLLTNQSVAADGGEAARPEALVGLSREEVAFRFLSQIRCFEGKDVSLTRESAVMMSQRIRKMSGESIEIKRADGSWRLLSGHRTSDGGQVVISADITNQKRQEAELRQARETLEDAIEALSEGFILYDEDDRIVTCNSRFRDLNGPCGDVLKRGVSWQEVNEARVKSGLFAVDDEIIRPWLESLNALREEESDYEFELSDGRWIHLAHRKTRQDGMVHTWRDISERKHMEMELRESEERVSQVLEACPVPIAVSRLEDGVIIYESPASRTLLGYDSPQEGNSVISHWVDPKDREKFLSRLRKTGAVDGVEVRYRKADGREFPCAISARLINYRGEEVAVTNLFDLTEQRNSEAEMTQQRELLHQSEKLSALGELLAGVSHELNNPLSVMVGQALMLRETAPDEDVASRAEKLTKAANRCAQIVKTFLTMARQEPGEIAPVGLNDLVEGALEMTAYALRTSNVEVSLRMAKDLPLISGDADQLRHVLTNLIINAQHALQDVEQSRKLRITSSYSKKNDQVVIKVKDNGPGIPAEIKTRIFEPLYTTKGVGKGTGIGLALCHRIVEAHGGTIAVEGTPDQGAVFAIRLPCNREDRLPHNAAKPVKARTGALKILVVDDEPDVAETICDILYRDGHAVEIVVSGRLAVELIKRHRYDVILSDLRMPELDGPGLYRALAKSNPNALDTLAFITGDTLSPDIRDFLEASERPYLEKPISPEDLRDLVNLLSRRRRS